MTRREFLRTDEMKSIRANIIICAVFGYVIAVGSMILNIALTKEFGVIYDAVFLIAMCVLVHFLQSRIASILIAIYAVLNVVIMFISTGKPGGIVVLVLAVYSIVYTFRFHSAWSKYKKSAADTEPFSPSDNGGLMV